ncbi:ryncolin-4-like [Mytilus trossulus]|uniref:ryncolin-4-like n=1 Tax=Mytilus trossulus TaxID=6551 RepID=UPI0030055ABF
MFKRLLAVIMLSSCLTESCGKSVSLSVNLKVAVEAHFNATKPVKYTYMNNNDFKPRDCSDLNKDRHKSGIYKISPDSGSSFNVYCDMDIDNGGWTVFQRRQDGKVDFYRDWKDYEDGFGNPKKEFWLGNKKLHKLTTTGNFTLRVDLSDFSGNKAYAKYKSFSIASASNKFKLTISGYSGNSGDGMGEVNGRPFVTKDQDLHNCAVRLKGAWWVRNCTTSCLNSEYKGSLWHGISWYIWKNKAATIKTAVMMIRRRK